MEEDERNRMIFAKDENVGGASVHSYRSLHKLYRFTNYNRLYSIESSHECPPDAVSSDGCPVTS